MKLEGKPVYKGGTCDTKGTSADCAVELSAGEPLTTTEVVVQDQQEISKAAIAALLGISTTLNVAS